MVNFTRRGQALMIRFPAVLLNFAEALQGQV